ncbi:AaceriAEL035Wp [[Ashbya] aceris (nom. inval.)]|nr:AaceriAEL035Wp [[Ashbya] aceris (nom. inval.)]
MEIITLEKADTIFDSYVEIALCAESSVFHWIYLRDNCTCEKCFIEATVQRTLDTFNELPWKVSRQTYAAEAPTEAVFEISEGNLRVTWPDGHVSVFSEDWLRRHSYQPALTTKPKALVFPPKSHWDRGQFEKLLGDGARFSTRYDNLVNELPTVLREIYEYGFTFVRDVPVSIEATKTVSELISIIRPTHYDTGVWDFTSDLAKKDTAYTTVAIDMHTDGNYWHELPGLQLFHLLQHSDGEGGETRIVDVAKIVDQLRELAAEDESWRTTYKVLTEHPLAFHQSGEAENVFYQADYPTLTLDATGELEQCRWNTSDRIAQAPLASGSQYTVPQVYQALFRFNSLINDEKNFVQFKLEPGTILVFDNWRVLHARTSFTGYRRLCGSYLTRDDFLARLRSIMFDREAIKDEIYQ